MCFDSVFIISFCSGSRSKPPLHRLRPKHSHREGLRRPPQVHAAHHVRRPGPARHVAPQQQPGRGQRVLLQHGAAGGAAEGQHEREDRVRRPGPHPVPRLRGRQDLELQLPRQSERRLRDDFFKGNFEHGDSLTKYLHDFYLLTLFGSFRIFIPLNKKLYLT